MNRAQLVLLLAADEFEENGNWCQGAYGRWADGTPCAMGDLAATRYCIAGIIDRIAGHRDIHTYVRAMNLVHRMIGGCDVAEWNDHPARTQAEVVAMLRRAAEQQPAEVG